MVRSWKGENWLQVSLRGGWARDWEAKVVQLCAQVAGACMYTMWMGNRLTLAIRLLCPPL